MLTRILSFLFPITRNIKSDHNGNLELTIINGKKLLNTANANYSYGSLQRVLKFSLQQLELSKTHEILLLGLGGGCVVKTLREDFSYRGKITAVDVDPIIISVAKKEFNVLSDEFTKIICSDAFNFVKDCDWKFDLIIVDLFVDNKVPDEFLTQEFWRYILEHLSVRGKIIFNTLCEPVSNLKPIEDKFRKRGLDYKIYRHVENTNRVLIANYY